MSSSADQPKEKLPGDGLRSVRTTSVFRTLNFELYAKPNKFVMAVGVAAFTGCVLYMAYMKHQWKSENVYTALNDKDELVLRKKQSRWD